MNLEYQLSISGPTLQFDKHYTKDGREMSTVFEEYRFDAMIGRESAGYVKINRILGTEAPEFRHGPLADLVFYRQGNILVPRSRVVFQHVSEQYRGRGLAGSIILRAHEFCKQHFQTPLFSGVSHQPNAARVWQKLVDDGKAIERIYDKEARWQLV